MYLLPGNTQAISIGPEDFYGFALVATEDKQMAGERILIESVLYARCQPVEAIAHIGDAGDQPDTRARRE